MEDTMINHQPNDQPVVSGSNTLEGYADQETRQTLYDDNQTHPPRYGLLGGGVLVSNMNGTVWRVWETQACRDGQQRCLCFNEKGKTIIIPRWQLTELTK